MAKQDIEYWTLERCQRNRKEIYELLNTKVSWKIFTWIFGFMFVIFAAIMSVTWNGVSKNDEKIQDGRLRTVEIQRDVRYIKHGMDDLKHELRKQNGRRNPS